ncbi:MAG: sensor histidine kinase [Leptospiraceae bacterium]|nr:sensor histidine kinase [Leptospiraceae bacterium]
MSNWLYSKNDDPSNKEANIDEKSWVTQDISNKFPMLEIDSYQGKAFWYRAHLQIESEIEDKAILLPIAFSGLQFYINGNLFYDSSIVNFGEKKVPYQYDKPQLLRITPNYLKRGDNVIALRVSNISLEGGFDGNLVFGNFNKLSYLWITNLIWVFSLTFISIYLFLYYLFYYSYRSKERYILYFSIMNFCMGIWLFTYKGFLFYFTLNSWGYSLFTFFIAPFVLVFLSNFIYSFLDTKQDKIIRGFNILYLLIALVVLIECLVHNGLAFYYRKYLFEPFIQSLMLFLGYLLYITIKAIRQKKPFAWRILIGIAFLNICFYYSVFVFLNIIKSDPILNEGFIIMSLVFATVLAKRFTTTFDQLEDLNLNLEQKVLDRTKQLVVANDELSVTNEHLNKTLSELEIAQKKIIKMEKETTEKQLAGGFAHEMRNALAGAKLVIGKIIPQKENEESLCSKNSTMLKEIFLKIKPLVDPKTMQDIAFLMRDINTNEETIERILGIVSSSTNRGLRVTTEILNYSEVGQVTKGEFIVNMESVIQKILNESQEEFTGYGITFQTDIEKVEILGNDDHFDSIVKNLILNSKDALTDKYTQYTKEKLIKVVCKKEDNFCRIEVTDTGMGIKKEHLHRIFDPFFSTKPSTGIGLGLGYISKLISIYNGKIEVESEPGEGTTFIVRLPLE